MLQSGEEYAAPYFTPWVTFYKTIRTVSVLGRDEGYTVKYNPLPEGAHEGEVEGTPEGNWLYLTVYPESSLNTGIISF